MLQLRIWTIMRFNILLIIFDVFKLIKAHLYLVIKEHYGHIDKRKFVEPTLTIVRVHLTPII